MTTSRSWSCRVAAAVLVAVTTGCGSADDPAIFGPSSSGDQNGSLSGTVTAFGSGEPVPRATLIMSGTVAVADAEGRFTFTGVPSTGAAGLTTDVSGYLFRGLAMQLAPARAGVAIDLIRNAPPFDLEFYRQLARNQFDSGLRLETRRWTVDPSFYVRTVTADSGEAVPAELIESLRLLFERSIPALSGGTRRLGAFEAGPAERPAADGWVNVTLMQQPPAGAFGSASVGGNSGTMTLRYPFGVSNNNTNPYNCTTPTLGVADHEITHTMGFWHTADVMVDTFSGEGCPGAPRPARTEYHARLMYSRPPGNRDPDIDPVEVLQSRTGAAMVVSCRFDPVVR